MQGTTFAGRPRRGPSHFLRVVPKGKQLLVIFSATGKGDGRFDFSRIAPTLPVSTLLLNDSENGWYQKGVPGLGESIVEVVDWITELSESFGISKLYTMGSSMGGYGALLYGARLNAKMLAFSPDTKLRAPQSYSSKLMPVSTEAIEPDLIPVLQSTKGSAHVICGELDARDMWHVARLMGIERVEFASLPGVGHAVPRALQLQDKLQGVIYNFLADQPPDLSIFNGTALTIPGLSDVLWNAYHAYQNGNREEALTLGLSALEMYPASECARVLLMQTYKDFGKAADALELLKGLTSKALLSPDVAILVGQIGRETGNPSLGIEALAELAAAFPDNDRVQYEFGMGLLGSGDIAGAKRAFERAILVRPNYKTYVRQLMSIEVMQWLE